MTTAAIIAVSVLFSWLLALLVLGIGYKFGIEQGWKEWEYGRSIHDEKLKPKIFGDSRDNPEWQKAVRDARERLKRKVKHGKTNL